MDEFLKKQLHENNLRFKRSLDRIINKYSQAQNEDPGIEVDLDHISPRKLENYMKLSEKKLNSLELKSFTGLREESLKAEDTTGDSQLDSSSDISIQHSVEEHGMTRNDITQLTVSSLDESQRNSNVELQPEDQDEELELCLKSHGSSLVELYPNMIRRIERAWHRQHISTAADSVLRRYHRWRQHSSRSTLNSTFVVTLRRTDSKTKKTSIKASPKKSSSSPVKGRVMKTEATPLQVVNRLQGWQELHRSPGEGAHLMRTQQHKPVLVMDFSASSEPCKTRDLSLNKTFTVSQLSPPKRAQLEEQAYTVSSSRPAVKSSNRPSRSALEMAGSSGFAPGFTAATPRADTYSSPLRLSPLKARAVASLGRSPPPFYRSPDDYSREPVRPRSVTTPLSSPIKRPVDPLRMLHPQNTQQVRSPRSVTAAGGHRRLVRHLSFDSFPPSTPIPYSPKQVDEDFVKLYHRFVCQNKSAFFNGPPCRLCVRNSEAGRGGSSSALAALALSPHRSVLRKRHRELECNSHPQSKRLREGYCTHSPGSNRHRREVQRQGIALSELETPRGGGLSYDGIKHSRSQRFRSQHPAEHEEPMLKAELSAGGRSLESKTTRGSSPRKW